MKRAAFHTMHAKMPFKSIWKIQCLIAFHLVPFFSLLNMHSVNIFHFQGQSLQKEKQREH